MVGGTNEKIRRVRWWVLDVGWDDEVEGRMSSCAGEPVSKHGCIVV